MVSVEKLKKGILLYIENHIAPLMSGGKGLLTMTFAPVILEANLKKYLASEWLEGTNLVDGNDVNVDEIYRLMKTTATSKWPIELLGFRFTESDLDNLYRMIKEA